MQDDETHKYTINDLTEEFLPKKVSGSFHKYLVLNIS